jgi:hypothetical protein
MHPTMICEVLQLEMKYYFHCILYSASFIISWALNVHDMADDILNYWICVVAGSFKDDQVNICPPHPGFFGGLCFRCGKSQDEEDVSGVAFGYVHKVHRPLTSLCKHERCNGVSLLHLPCLNLSHPVFEINIIIMSLIHSGNSKLFFRF